PKPRNLNQANAVYTFFYGMEGSRMKLWSIRHILQLPTRSMFQIIKIIAAKHLLPLIYCNAPYSSEHIIPPATGAMDCHSRLPTTVNVSESNFELRHSIHE